MDKLYSLLNAEYPADAFECFANFFSFKGATFILVKVLECNSDLVLDVRDHFGWQLLYTLLTCLLDSINMRAEFIFGQSSIVVDI